MEFNLHKYKLPNQLFTKNTWRNLLIYGLGHFIVDAICAGLIFSLLNTSISIEEAAFLIILYNIFAFGLQLPFGFLSDKLMNPKYFVITGLIIAAIGGLIGFFSPIIGISLVGIGNALVHIGGGVISLNLTPKKASAPGIFVAPGAIGLLVGTLLGKASLFNPHIFSIIALILCGLIFLTNHPKINYSTKQPIKIDYIKLILILLFLTIVSRSVIGFAISFPWKTDFLLLLALTIGVFFGKSLGGILGDKFGWGKIGVGGLLLCIPFVLLGPQYAILGIFGMFLFNFTMPITLVAISNILPGRPGFSFGLTCMALLIGAFPFLSGFGFIFSNINLIIGIILVAAVMLFVGLKLGSKANLAVDKAKAYKNEKTN